MTSTLISFALQLSRLAQAPWSERCPPLRKVICDLRFGRQLIESRTPLSKIELCVCCAVTFRSFDACSVQCLRSKCCSCYLGVHACWYRTNLRGFGGVW
mmetsp:Transcript_69571/g.213302  ORF Transcript_69571/g.213302 Transcript_69571/m.213302 type:complete len:99 (+) Transcript_69571:862-1158(+)